MGLPGKQGYKAAKGEKVNHFVMHCKDELTLIILKSINKKYRVSSSFNHSINSISSNKNYTKLSNFVKQELYKAITQHKITMNSY